jgi:hypothetical protein
MLTVVISSKIISSGSVVIKMQKSVFQDGCLAAIFGVQSGRNLVEMQIRWCLGQIVLLLKQNLPTHGAVLNSWPQ